jgi:hypothetical protein
MLQCIEFLFYSARYPRGPTTRHHRRFYAASPWSARLPEITSRAPRRLRARPEHFESLPGDTNI